MRLCSLLVGLLLTTFFFLIMLMHDDEPSMPSHTYFNICVVSLIIRGSYAKLIKRGKHFTSTMVVPSFESRLQ